jgi:hypothetical protein
MKSRGKIERHFNAKRGERETREEEKAQGIVRDNAF